MESENRHEFDVTLATFEHPRYEIVPTGPIRMQNEPIVRALSADITDPRAVAAGLEPLRTELEAARDDTASREGAAGEFPSRERVLLINHRLAQKLVVAQLEWLDEIQEELRARG
jgi:hypothetical protein